MNVISPREFEKIVGKFSLWCITLHTLLFFKPTSLIHSSFSTFYNRLRSTYLSRYLECFPIDRIIQKECIYDNLLLPIASSYSFFFSSTLFSDILSLIQCYFLLWNYPVEFSFYRRNTWFHSHPFPSISYNQSIHFPHPSIHLNLFSFLLSFL